MAVKERWASQPCASSATGEPHAFVTAGYRNGCGTCTRCGGFGSDVFDLADIGSLCSVCGVGTYWAEDDDGRLFCRAHAPTFLCSRGHEHESELEAGDCTRKSAPDYPEGILSRHLDPVSDPTVFDEEADAGWYRVVAWRRFYPPLPDEPPGGRAVVDRHRTLEEAVRAGQGWAASSITRAVWVYSPDQQLQCRWRQHDPDTCGRDNVWRNVGEEAKGAAAVDLARLSAQWASRGHRWIP